MNRLRQVDPEIAAAIEAEAVGRAETIELNAATNLPDPSIIEAQANVMAHKTLEGYPGRRYHGGHHNVDIIENLAVERAKRLFGAEYANVQPHCGTHANLAVYLAVLNPGDAILGMDLTMGGHLSHGHGASFSGRFFNAHTYGLDRETEGIDYDGMRRIAREVRPRMIVCGGSSYPRIIDFRRFRDVADEVGAYLLADIAHVAGLVAGGVYPSPVPHADFVTFTGYKTLKGARGGVVLCKRKYGSRIDSAVFPGIQGSMHVHLMAGKAVTFRLASLPDFKVYAEQVVKNAQALAGCLSEMGYRIVTGGTDTHVVLVDLRNQGITGAEAQERLEEAGIICNKNRIPFDPLGADRTSGIRLGTSAVTERGFRESEMTLLAEMMDRALSGKSRVEEVRREVKALCRHFPLGPGNFQNETPGPGGGC
ncbi:MAG: serine hydroxymethyltransferase [Deltaproteobacteria bacterium]|nr:serine hydroxymethyltransferase [Deltaproteobacteria bacterium]MBW2017736.1 serine hydroxymethyltransferase [Deltaproteobacteria bacterium]MBW2128873.1 serine hydroxymethyltransferase [Deltaproteobacteria bacterium]MBW2304460.1 serine hydroxymethyltransferase [Deltaproteobacteria bacterium]